MKSLLFLTLNNRPAPDPSSLVKTHLAQALSAWESENIVKRTAVHSTPLPTSSPPPQDSGSGEAPRSEASHNHLDSTPPKVLVVESSGDTSEVLRTILERRGIKVLNTEEHRDGLALMREHLPRVTVLDLDSESEAFAEYQQQSNSLTASLVVLGTVKPSELGSFPSEQIIDKPYHYGELIRTIEAMVREEHVQSIARRAS